MPLLLNSVVVILVVVILYKLRKAHLLLFDLRDQSRQDSVTLFRQLEALQGLYAELDLKTSLPPTRGWAASPDFLLEVARHARMAKPSCVLECSSGTSTLVLARCLQLNGAGKVLSLEHDPHYAEQTRQQLRHHGLQEWALVLNAPLLPYTLSGESWSWYDISALPSDLKIDLLVIDGPPQDTRTQARYPAGPLLFPGLTKPASIFLDDAARSDEQAIVQRWQQEFPALRLSSRVCEKGCAVLVNAT